MERKLIKQGGGGFTIYLPKKWVDKKGLHEGDIVDVKEIDSSLIIGSELKGKEEISIEITQENKEDIGAILTHAYRRGFNGVVLKGVDSELARKIRQITKDFLLGFEITEKTTDSCKIENISEPTEQKYDVMIGKVFLIIKETQNMIIEDFQDNYENWDEIEEMKKNQDKFILFCRRLLVKEKYEKDPVLEWELLTFLMHIEHAYFYLYKYARENKVKIDKNAVELLRKLQEQFSLYQDAYFHKNIKSLYKIMKQRTKFQFGKCLDLIEKSKDKKSVVYCYIKEIFRLIQIGCSPILSKNLSY